MAKINKYCYLIILQGNYGRGWEDLCAATNHKEIHEDAKAYRENEGGCYRVIRRRELNPH